MEPPGQKKRKAEQWISGKRAMKTMIHHHQQSEKNASIAAGGQRHHQEILPKWSAEDSM